jgi:hypothetical protein
MVASKQIDLGSESVQRLITSAAWLCEETRLVWRHDGEVIYASASGRVLVIQPVSDVLWSGTDGRKVVSGADEIAVARELGVELRRP